MFCFLFTSADALLVLVKRNNKNKRGKTFGSFWHFGEKLCYGEQFYLAKSYPGQIYQNEEIV